MVFLVFAVVSASFAWLPREKGEGPQVESPVFAREKPANPKLGR